MVERLTGLFDKLIVVDRRELPTHGYRAVHVVVDYSGKLIEIQVRTSLQQVWAEVSEKISDVIDPAIKYGEGNQEVLSLLANASKLAMEAELAIQTRDTDRIIATVQLCVESFVRLGDLVGRIRRER